MSVFKCKICGGTLQLRPDQRTAVCEYCATEQTLPKLEDEAHVRMFDRANHLRRNHEFDRAMELYAQIVNEDATDAEAYWSIVLCRYGVEYVEDPQTHRRVPTVNRAQFTSVLDDEDYKAALAHADERQRMLYQQEARQINEIQKGILAISGQEKPFDVFLCYKETDETGARTPDSVLANDLYHLLTQAGYRTFFARITLEDKLGTAYEPYIFAALNSARVMVVLGTKAAYFNAPWVKNEWSRYLALVRESHGQKVLIPAYRDMDPYDLPEAFSHLQALDMGKLGFMQDLLRGITKIIRPEAVQREDSSNQTEDLDALLRRVELFLEDEKWQQADAYCERVLDREPENARAYLGKLMAQLHVRTQQELCNQAEPFDGNDNYEKALRFADAALGAQLTDCISAIKSRNEQARNEKTYQRGIAAMQQAGKEADFKAAAAIFEQIAGFADADHQAAQCRERADACRRDAILHRAVAGMEQNSTRALREALAALEQIAGWKDADARAAVCRARIAQLDEDEARRMHKQSVKERRKRRLILIGTCVVVVLLAILMTWRIGIAPVLAYRRGNILLAQGDTVHAAMAYGEAYDFKDARQRAGDLWDDLAYRQTLCVTDNHIAVLHDDGTVEVTPLVKNGNLFGQCNVTGWQDMIAVCASSRYTVGLRANGTLAVVGNWNDGLYGTSSWQNIVSVSAGDRHLAALCADGTVAAAGNRTTGACDVSQWKDMVALCAGADHTVGLRADGTVAAVGDNRAGQCNVRDWTDIVYIGAGAAHTLGIRADGTVVAAGANQAGQCNVSDWSNIVSICGGNAHTVGLRADGTVVAAGDNSAGQCDVQNWTNVACVAAGGDVTIALTRDGQFLCTY